MPVWPSRADYEQSLITRAETAEKALLELRQQVTDRAHPRDASCACDWCKLAYDRSDMPPPEVRK